MQTHEKLRVMRQCKSWTQEEMAEKLGWTLNSYAKVERGEVDIKLDKLKKIANVMGVDVQELVDSDEKTVFNFAENCNQSNLSHCTILLTETQCANKLEQAHLLLEERHKEIEYLKQQVAQLQEIISLMKKSSSDYLKQSNNPLS
jgi:transcriptional regulator with XRE-family HTH domain